MRFAATLRGMTIRINLLGTARNLFSLLWGVLGQRCRVVTVRLGSTAHTQPIRQACKSAERPYAEPLVVGSKRCKGLPEVL